MSSNLGLYIFLGVAVLAVIVLYYFQSKRRRAAQAEYTGMLDTLRPGTRVKTVGGVIGKIVEIREEAPGFKTVLLETGNEKNPSFVLYDMQAIYGIVDADAIAKATAAATGTAGTSGTAAETPKPQKDDVQKNETADGRVYAAEDAFEAKKTKKKSQK